MVSLITSYKGFPYHPNKDISCSIQRLDSRRPHSKLHQPRYFAHQELHQTPVVEYADDGSEVNHYGEHLLMRNNSYTITGSNNSYFNS